MNMFQSVSDASEVYRGGLIGATNFVQADYAAQTVAGVGNVTIPLPRTDEQIEAEKKKFTTSV